MARTLDYRAPRRHWTDRGDTEPWDVVPVIQYRLAGARFEKGAHDFANRKAAYFALLDEWKLRRALKALTGQQS